MAKISADKMLSKARSLEKNGDIQSARKAYEAILEEFPKNTRARKRLEQLDQSRREHLNAQMPQVILEKLIALYNGGNIKKVLEGMEDLNIVLFQNQNM